MPRDFLTDDLPTRQSMRDPHKSRHTSARFTLRTTPARFHSNDRMAR